MESRVVLGIRLGSTEIGGNQLGRAGEEGLGEALGGLGWSWWLWDQWNLE